MGELANTILPAVVFSNRPTPKRIGNEKKGNLGLIHKNGGISRRVDSSERGIGKRIWFIIKVTLSISVERKKSFMNCQL